MSRGDKQMSRRALLMGWRKGQDREAKEQQQVAAPSPNATPPVRRPSLGGVPLLRPPGAAPETEFLSACTSCGDCVRACPYGALTQTRTEEEVSPPFFDMARAPCRLCPDRPCVRVCPTDALREERATRIGRAHLRVMNCLATQLSACSVCVERCPVEGAIEMVGGKPRIRAGCIGCGEYLYRCPAPTKALFIMPA